MLAILQAILPVLLELIEATPALIDDVQSVWKLLTATTAPTATQQAAIDAALDAAHAKLQGQPPATS